MSTLWEGDCRIMEKLIKEQKKLAKKLAEEIFNAFSWDKTKQGVDYWKIVSDELLELAKGKTKCPTCGK